MSTDGDRKDDGMLFAPAELVLADELGGADGKYIGSRFATNEELRNRNVMREVVAGFLNLCLFSAEQNRDAFHGDSPTTISIPTEKLVPLQSEGVVGFFDQHMGNSLETLAAIYGWRIPIEMVARVYETASDKKVNPHHKMALAIFLGMFTVGALEMTKSNGDQLDWFGSLLAGVWAGGAWTVSYHLTKPRENHLFDQMWGKWINTMEQVDGLSKAGKNKIKELKNWGGGLLTNGEEATKRIMDTVGGWMQEQGEMHQKAFDYLEMEAKVANLMIEDWQNKQADRLVQVLSGKIGDEG